MSSDDGYRRDVQVYIAQHLAFVERAVMRVAAYLVALSPTFAGFQRNFADSDEYAANSAAMIRPGRVSRVEDLLLYLAAVLQLHDWETAGLRRFLPSDLPTSTDAFRDFRAQVRSNAASESDLPGVALLERVIWTWSETFERPASIMLGADVVRQGKLPDSAVTALAEFLWKYRHLGRKEQGDAV